MSKGTPAQGKRNSKKSHIRCRRCGRHSYHTQHKSCASCGFGTSRKLTGRTWAKVH